MSAIRDTAFIMLGLIGVGAALVWGSWEVDFGISRTTFLRLVWGTVLTGCLLFWTLLTVLVWAERDIHYRGGRPSSLHIPLIVSTFGLAAYFGIASISAVDFFVHANRTWPLTQDPTLRILGTTLIIVIVTAKAWMLWEILPSGRWTWVHMPMALGKFLNRGV
jgi:hypothetical protein